MREAGLVAVVILRRCPSGEGTGISRPGRARGGGEESVPSGGFYVLLPASWIAWRLLKRYLSPNPLDNILGPASPSLLAGHMGLLFGRHEGWGFHRTLGEDFRSVVRLKGLFGSDVLYVFDPVALSQVLSKGDAVYPLSEALMALSDTIYGPSMMSVRGPSHRRQRRIINPVFSIENIRKLTPMFYDVAHKAEDAIAKDCHEHQEIDVLRWTSRAALEFIARGGMGTSFNLFASASATHPMLAALKNIIPVMNGLMAWFLLLPYLHSLGPPQFRKLLADLAVWLLPDENLGKLRDIVNDIERTSQQIYRDSKLSYEADVQGGAAATDDEPKNMMSLLLRANSQADESHRLTEKELIAQLGLIFFGGTDTASGVLARILQLLATHQDVQQKLRDELESSRDYPGQDIPYEKLMELPYLGAICRETLRLYMPANGTTRDTVVDDVLDLAEPVRGLNGSLITQIHVPKGTTIVPGYITCNTAKNLWGEDALEWKPERWMNPLPEAVQNAHIPSVYSKLATFGSGERACVGFRFALLELRVFLAVLVSSFRFSPTDKEVFWHWAAVTYPSMSKDEIEPGLLLTVEKL